MTATRLAAVKPGNTALGVRTTHTQRNPIMYQTVSISLWLSSATLAEEYSIIHLPSRESMSFNFTILVNTRKIASWPIAGMPRLQAVTTEKLVYTTFINMEWE